jgi:hypothetical protein
MKAETNIKAVLFDWISKILLAVVMFIVKDIRDDVKQLMQTVPALQAKVDILTDQRLIERFRMFQPPPPAKQEDFITYDSLKRR